VSVFVADQLVAVLTSPLAFDLSKVTVWSDEAAEAA